MRLTKSISIALLMALLSACNATGPVSNNNVQTSPTSSVSPIDTQTPAPINTHTPVPFNTHTPVPFNTHTPVPINTHTPVPINTQTPVPINLKQLSHRRNTLNWVNSAKAPVPLAGPRFLRGFTWVCYSPSLKISNSIC